MIPLLRMTVQTKSLTARKKRKESFEMDIKRAGSQFMAVCAFVNLRLFFNQTWRKAPAAPLWVLQGAANLSKV